VTPDRLSLHSAKITYDEKALSADLTLKLDKIKPHLEGSLAFMELDLKRALGKTPLTTVQNVVNLIETDLRLSTNTLSWDTFKTGTAAFTLNSKGGHITAEIADLEFLDGAVRGHLRLILTDTLPRMQMRLTAENINAAEFLALLHQGDWLTGQANADIEANLHWGSQGILKGSTADIKVDFPEGGQIRLDIPRLAKSAASVLNGWDGVDYAHAVFQELRFLLTLRNGQLRYRNLELVASDTLVNGSGAVDLFKQTLDLRFNVSPLGESAPSKQDTSSNLSITGGWFHPTIRTRSIVRASKTGKKTY
jgi:hypothetical protein